jgi:pimeloyl-ACP methyl ester carboxylesterase
MLAVRGEHSTIVSPQALEEYRLVGPHIELAEVAGAHHHIMLDQPLALADVLNHFLDRSRPA